MATFTRNWSEASPTDSDYANEIDDFMRNLRVDMSDRLSDIIYGFTTDENDGVQGCKWLPFKVQASDPTVASSTISLYSKDVSAEAHLYFKDESTDVRQVTKAGGLLNIIAGDYAADSVDEDDILLANDSYLTGRNNADDGDIDILKVNTSDVVEVGTNVEFGDNQALNFILENRTNDTGMSVEGQIWFRTDV